MSPRTWHHFEVVSDAPESDGDPERFKQQRQAERRARQLADQRRRVEFRVVRVGGWRRVKRWVLYRACWRPYPAEFQRSGGQVFASDVCEAAE